MARAAHAMDGASAYYGVYLSDRIIETDVGIICLDAVIARTGKQDYRFQDLPQEEARELGLKGSPMDLVTLWREPEDVFDPEFIASLEGKPVTDAHPSRLLDRDNVLDHSRGHMANVRPGKEPLKSGDMPLLSDLHIIGKSLITKIKNGLRQLSCGYTYHIALDGGRILQVGMLGNHCAVLPSGRAGHEARIYDAAPNKEIPVAITHNFLKGLALRALAAIDGTTPEQMAEAATAFDGISPGARTILPLGKPRRIAAAALDQEDDDQETFTAAEVLELVKRDRKRRAGKGGQAQDADDDGRKRAHSMLDRMLDAKGKQAADEDADLDEFKSELRELLEESDEEDGDGEANDADDDDDDKDMQDADDDEDDDDDDKKKKPAKDGELRGGEIIPVGDRQKSAFGSDGKKARDGKGKRAGMDGEDVLKVLRPYIAKTADRKVRAAFDATLKNVRAGRVRGIHRDGAGYKAFTDRAGQRADDQASDEGKSLDEKLNAAYAARHRQHGAAVAAKK